MKLKKFKQFILERNDFSSWEKPDDNPTYDSWGFPSKDALRLEYKVEHELKGHDWFKSEEEFIEKAYNSEVEEITPEKDRDIIYRSGTESYEQIMSLIKGYRSYPEFRNEKTVQNLYNRISKNQELDMPIVIEFLGGKRRIFSGNTRMDVAFQMGCNVKALIIKVDSTY